jgi:hypothetical protein
MTAEAPEKAKNAPLRDYYNPNICFALIFGAFVVMLFFRADDLFGAVGLRAFYTIGSIASVFVAAILILVMLSAWRKLDAIATAIFIVLLVLAVFIFNEMLFGLILVGWFTGIVIMLIPAVFPALGAVVTLSLWIFSTGFRSLRFSPAVLKIFKIAVLIMTPLYLLGVGAYPKNAEFDFVGSESFAGHHYYLDLHHGWLGDPDWLILWQCNSLAFDCETVFQSPYHSPPEQFRNLREKDIQLIPDVIAVTISILVDGEVVYTHQPG